MGRETWLEDVLGRRRKVWVGGGTAADCLAKLHLAETDGKQKQRRKQRAACLEEGRRFYLRSLGATAVIDAAV